MMIGDRTSDFRPEPSSDDPTKQALKLGETMMETSKAKSAVAALNNR
jgi:hypothetical protein